MSDENLEPKACPFCGGPATVVENDRWGSVIYWVECQNDCPVRPHQNRYRFDRNEAVAAWNTRVPS